MSAHFIFRLIENLLYVKLMFRWLILLRLSPPMDNASNRLRPGLLDARSPASAPIVFPADPEMMAHRAAKPQA